MLTDKKAFVLITGASQNIGKAFAEEWSARLGKGSKMVLTSRSVGRLEGVRSGIMQKNHDHQLQVKLVEWDLAKPDSIAFKQEMERLMPKDEPYDVALLVHNAFSLGDLKKKVEDMNNVQELRTEFDTNVVSMVALTSAFLHAAAQVKEKVVVNLTAPSATKAYPSLGMSGAARAARQNILSCLAAENPAVKVLHFDPGVVDNSTTQKMRAEMHDPSLRQWLKKFVEDKLTLSEDHVADKLWKTIDAGKFTSGSTVSSSHVLDVKLPIP